MKIAIKDQYEIDKANSYFAGFNTGVFNTVANIVEIRKRGLSLAKLYKLIEKKYKQECKRLEHENINK